MSAHDRFAEKLITAGRQGQDLLAAAREEREHLGECPKCRDAIVQIASAIRGEEERCFLELERREDLGLLQEPPAYPRFDLAFLASEISSNLWVSSASDSDGAPTSQIRRLVGDLELRFRIFQQTVEAVIEGWPFARSIPPALAVVPAFRGGSSAQAQMISLPDAERDLEVVVTVEAAEGNTSHLAIQVRCAKSGLPSGRTRISLEYDRGKEVVYSPMGKALFIGLSPDRYEVEIRPSVEALRSTVWRFGVALEAGGA